MFEWWISWVWVCIWMATISQSSGVWISKNVKTSYHKKSILPDYPSNLGVPTAPGALRAPSRLPPGAKGSQGKGELGPGMGGSAVEPPEGREGAQYFATQPTPQTAVVGSTAVLPCRVINKVGHLQWTRDGFGLGTDRDLSGFSRYSMIGSDDEGDFSLRIQPVVVDDDATYQCQVSAMSDIPGIRSHRARLTVYVPPRHPTVRPPLLSTTEGLSVTLECESSGGRPPPEIQWVDDSRRETIHTGITQSTQTMSDGKRVTVISHLTFSPTRSHHNSSITCLTSNQALSSPLSSSVQISVLFPPEVKLEIQPGFLSEGDDAKFTCTANANPSVMSYRWYHNNQELKNETSRVLILKKISRTLHYDTIACQVSNVVGTSKKTQTIHVQYGPYFRALPKDVMAETGTHVIIKCAVDSNPPASIVWLHEGSDKIIGSGDVLGVAVDSESSGIYICLATVRGFPELRGVVKVLEKGPPTIVSPPEQEGKMGHTVTINCTTVSVPSPIRITWTYNGRDIDLSDPRYEVIEEEHDDGLRNLLIIHDSHTHDFGAYNCSVVNEYGVARKQIRLNEEKNAETVPFVVVVGSVVGLVVIGMVVVLVSLVLCNKRRTNIKGPPVSEKAPSLNMGPAPTVTNMYSAPSETKLSEYLSSSLATTNRNIDQEDSNDRKGYSSLLNHTEQLHNHTKQQPNHTNSQLLNHTKQLPNHTKTNHPNHATISPDFCNSRRLQGCHISRDPDLVRGTDLKSTVHLGNTDFIRGTDISGVTFYDTDLSGVTFSDTDLVSGMSLYDTDKLRRVDLVRENDNPSGMTVENDLMELNIKSGMRNIDNMRGKISSGMSEMANINSEMSNTDNFMRGNISGMSDLANTNGGMRTSDTLRRKISSGMSDLANINGEMSNTDNFMSGKISGMSEIANSGMFFNTDNIGTDIMTLNNRDRGAEMGTDNTDTHNQYQPVLLHNGAIPPSFTSPRNYPSPPPPYTRNSQIVSPNTSQIVSQNTSLIVSPNTSQIVSPKASQIISQNTSQIVSPNTSQIVSKNTSQIVSPNTSQIVSQNASQIVSPNTSQIVSPNTSQIVSQNASQIVSPNTSQIVSQNASQIVSQFDLPTPKQSDLVTSQAMFIFSPEAMMKPGTHV